MMESKEIQIDEFNRLSLGIIEKNLCSPEEAMDTLASLHINLICGEGINSSLPLQAALITAVNAGKRSFLGGVHVCLSKEINCLVPWTSQKHLHEIINELGGIITEQIDQSYSCIFFGSSPMIRDNDIRVVCNTWQAGLLTNGDQPSFPCTGMIPTAGIFAGGLAIAVSFLKSSGINILAADYSTGISLWRPDKHWLDADAIGPDITLLPQKYWLLGLGHLGQAYIWNIALLPYPDSSKVNILLQDDDKVVKANWSAGLLTEENPQVIYKTRMCSAWLEKRGFSTTITERRFDEYTKRMDEEPFVALCGFDSAASRVFLENAGFDLIIESGLGNNQVTFDMISFHTFPDSTKTPIELWGDSGEDPDALNPNVFEVLEKLDTHTCGIVARTLSGKSVSASFVGVCSGALAIAEILRGLHGGFRFDKIAIQLRDISGMVTLTHTNKLYSIEESRNGFVEL